MAIIVVALGDEASKTEEEDVVVDVLKEQILPGQMANHLNVPYVVQQCIGQEIASITPKKRKVGRLLMTQVLCLLIIQKM